MKRGPLIGLASLTGAGKGELSESLAELGVEHVNLGTLVRQTAADAGFIPAEATREAYLPFWAEHAKNHGEDWIAQYALSLAKDTGRLVLIDGVRIPADAKTIVDNGTLFWLHADIPTLATRMEKRNRFDDQKWIRDRLALIASLTREINDTGHFPMGTIRDLCDVHLLPTPEINDESLRRAYYNKLAGHVIDVATRA